MENRSECKKVKVLYWSSSVPQKGLQYYHEQLISAPTIDIVQHFLNKGLNVMVLQGEQVDTVLVDNKYFKQS